MLLLMIERGLPINTVLWADTDMEFPEMYDHISKVDDYLYRERGIHITMLRHPKGFEYLMFEEEKQKPSSIENRQRLGVSLYGNGWPGAKVRWCTGQLKTHLISKEVNRLSPATVSFSINGSTYRMNNIVIPSGDSQIAWVKWHTPSEPQDITIYVSTNKGSLSQSTIHAKVVDLSGNDPPDPKATDTMGSWSASSIPSRETKTYAAWSVWWAKWHPYWVWHSTGKNTGYWVDDGWYDYFRDNYSASMTATTRIEPDEKVPTASGDLMKSG